MSDDLTRLLDMPAAARLSVAGDEIALVTLIHEHADKLVIERRRLGTSIDLGDLLRIIGSHGIDPGDLRWSDLMPASGVALGFTEIVAPQLPAPAEAASAPTPTTRRTTRNQPVPHLTSLACSKCERTFASQHALDVHDGRLHKEPRTPAVEPLQARAAHREAVQAAVVERVPCPHCDKTFHPNGLGPHVAKIHKATPDAVEVPVIPIAIAPGVDGICGVCNTSVKLHERCSDCTALLGPEHEAGMIVAKFMGQPLCASCTSFRDVAQEIGVAA